MRRLAILFLVAAACAEAEPIDLPSAVAYRLDVRALAAVHLPAETTWGRPIAQPRLAEAPGHRTYVARSWRGFECDEDAAHALLAALEPDLGRAIEARGGRVVHAARNGAGPSFVVEYELGRVNGAVHVELRPGSDPDYPFELLVVFSERAPT